VHKQDPLSLRVRRYRFPPLTRLGGRLIGQISCGKTRANFTPDACRAVPRALRWTAKRTFPISPICAEAPDVPQAWPEDY